MRTALFILCGALAAATQQPQASNTPSAAQQQPATDPASSVPKDAPAQQAPASTQRNNGQTNPDTPVEAPETTFSVKAPEVNVIFTVTDKRGKFIRDLTKDNVSVSDNKQKVPEIRQFTSETNLPLRVGLLVDLSSSIRQRFKFEQQAAMRFLEDIIRPKDDLAFTIGFDTTAETTQDWTNSSEKLSNGIRMMRPGGGTALYDAIYLACRDKLMKRQDKGPVRKAIILLTDGEDNQSRATLREAIEMAQRAEVIIYTISTSEAPNDGKGEQVMKKLSEETGGRMFRPFKIEDVSDAFRDIQEELRAQYALSYRPPQLVADGAFHEINIEVPKNKKLKVRARKGYYAPANQ